jgi:hypothetical protein
MGRIIGLLIAVAILGWGAVAQAVRAFSVPWNGKFDQWIAILNIVVVAAFSLTIWGLWGLAWWRGGMAGVRAYEAERREIFAVGPGLSKKFYAMSWVFWIVVAIALVVYFHYHPPH